MNSMRHLIRAAVFALSSTTSLMTTACGSGAAVTSLAETKGAYKDGSYTATGQYGNLPSFLTVNLTLARGVIVAVTVQTHATDPTSLDFQRRFAAAVPSVVIGRSIDDAHVGKLAGASGCPIGFNAAIDQIKAEASS